MKSTRGFALKSTHGIAIKSTNLASGESAALCRNTRQFYDGEESCYIIDAKLEGNLGRYLNVRERERERSGGAPSLGLARIGSPSPPRIPPGSSLGDLAQRFSAKTLTFSLPVRLPQHSCSPNLFVQNVFVDTHDLRFPWVAFFASK